MRTCLEVLQKNIIRNDEVVLKLYSHEPVLATTVPDGWFGGSAGKKDNLSQN